MSVHAAVGELPAASWDALLAAPGEEVSPFLEHAFLTTLEDAGALGEPRGWIPRILAVRRAGRLVAAAPAYVKLHSHGEFVFDFAFADLAARRGLPYYPKLLVGVPFTPVTGRRLLTAPGEDRGALLGVLGRGLLELAEALGCSSVHVNFAREEEVAALGALGFEARHGIQYHWYRRGAAGFDDYLVRFTSKKRNQLRRERRALADLGVALRVVRGEALEDERLLALGFEFYCATVEKYPWGRQYLSAEAFRLLGLRCRHRMELVLAEDARGAPLGGAVNFASDRRLYGRYWGAREEVRFLHFGVCYYRGIEECLGRGLEAFEPGAGGEHKLVRGFEPTLTRSAHWFADPRLFDPIRRYFADERAAVDRERAARLASLGADTS